jgi:hypothetical protein
MPLRHVAVFYVAPDFMLFSEIGVTMLYSEVHQRLWCRSLRRVHHRAKRKEDELHGKDNMMLIVELLDYTLLGFVKDGPSKASCYRHKKKLWS